MVPSREPGRETGMESWVTEPRKGTCLDVFHPDFQERPEERISIDAARCMKVGRKIVATQTGAVCAEKHAASSNRELRGNSRHLKTPATSLVVPLFYFCHPCFELVCVKNMNTRGQSIGVLRP